MEQYQASDKIEPILDDLYAIRTGMSIISQKTDELYNMYDDANQQLLEMDYMIAQNVSKIETASGTPILSKIKQGINSSSTDQYKIGDPEIDDMLDEYLHDTSGRENRLYGSLVSFLYKQKLYDADSVTEIEKTAVITENVYQKCKHTAKRLKTLFAISILLTLACSVLAFTVSGFLFFAAAVFLIFTIIFGRKCFGTHRYNVSEYEKIYKCSIETLSLIKKYITVASDFHSKIIPATKPTIQSCTELYREMCNQYHIIDVRDWKYTDTLIFYFETGRADTIKEALPHLDQQIQTNEIVGAIETAAEHIATAIGQMSDAICKALNKMSYQLSLINRAQSTQISQTSALLTQQSMQTALLAKASYSSEQPAADTRSIADSVRYLKNS